jgi:hypothetical protein
VSNEPNDPRFTAGLLYDVLCVLEKNGFTPGGGSPETTPQQNRRVSACLVALLGLTRAFEGKS